MKIEIITVHPGKQHNFEQIEQLAKHFKSVKHITSVAFSSHTIDKLRFLPRKILKELEKRSIDAKTSKHISIYPLLELFYKWKRLTKQSISNDFFKKRNRLFQLHVLKKYQPPKIFIGFDTSSELIFEKWKGKTILLLDLTIAPPLFKKKLADDYKLPTAKAQNLTNGDEIWYNTYQKELDLADFILCGSYFVKESCMYLGIKEEKLKVIPYGANLDKFAPLTLPERRSENCFKIAFIGNVSYRKGADVLLRAWEKLAENNENIELHFFGNVQIELNAYNLKNVFFHGFIIQSEMVKALAGFHISILPTFFEGSSIAVYQSMALGLAVVTTYNCGSIIKNMENGIIIEYGSEAQIHEALTLLIQDRNLRLKLSEAAMLGIKDYTWNNYGFKLKNFIATLLK